MSLAVDASNAAASVASRCMPLAVPIALIAPYFGLPGPMEGTVKIDARLRGTGRTGHGIAASLDGPVSADSSAAA